MKVRGLSAIGACWCSCSALLLVTACSPSNTSTHSGAAGSLSSAGADTAGSATNDGSDPTAGGSAAGTESGNGGDGAAAAGDAGSSDDSGGEAATDKFSFFVTSWAGLQRLAKEFGLPNDGADGFGGDLRFGESGPGAGLRGADKICTTLAEASMKGAGAKGWRAFLSASDDGSGKPVNAIDRVGTGPWYDRLGRLFGDSVADIAQQRPASADAAIKNDFPNEDGVPNHQPDPTVDAVDNHDVLTGSDETGKLLGADSNCLNWSSAEGDTTKEGKPRVGHSWPRNMGGGGMVGGGMFGGGMGPAGLGDQANWMSALTESGCKAGANLKEQGGPLMSAVTVGSGGGYGGFYCFALKP